MEPSHFESLYPENSRFEEIEKILNFVKEGNSCELIGLPGAGKSNVLGFLSYNKNIKAKHLGENAKWFHFVLLNFSEIRKRPLADAYKFIFLGLIESLNGRKMKEEYEKVNSIFKEAVNLSDELVLFQGLKKAIDFLCIEEELTTVFLMDRFEEYAQMTDSSFFANLRTLRNRAKYRFSVIFSLPRPLDNLIEPSIFADLHEFLAGHEVYLKLMDKDGLDFRISYLEKVSGKKIDGKIKNQILNLTGGHGKLTRLCLESTLATDFRLQQVTVDGRQLAKIEDFLLEQKNIQGALFEIWNFLLTEEKKRIKNPFDKTQGKHELRITNDFLEKVGLIKDGKIQIPLFETYISAIKQSSNEAISYNPSNNEITKGEVAISDQLSSSEFNLLRFLIENSGRICEKEEIINAVWKDSKTQEGVTDQALDQIVYRLRKKIEEDPNNPAHIQTIKGRGLKFSS